MSNRSEFTLRDNSDDRCGECGHARRSHMTPDTGCKNCERMNLHCSGFRLHTAKDLPITDKENIAKLLGVLENSLDSIKFWLDTAIIDDENSKVILDKSTCKRIREYIRQSQNVQRTLVVLNNKGE